MRHTNGCCLVLATALAGCGHPSRPADTGARAVALRFAEAIRSNDWAEAYTLLHPASQARYPQEDFRQRAERYRRDLRFEPQAVHIVACGERGHEALAHVVFSGTAAGAQRRYKDVFALEPGATGWAVVLQAHFGQPHHSGNR